MFDNLPTLVNEAEESDLLIAGGEAKEKGKPGPKSTPKEPAKEKQEDGDGVLDTKKVDDLEENELDIAAGESDDEDEDDDDKEGKDEDDKSKKEDEDEAGEISTEDFLKARANFLISKGEWADIEDKDTIEWTEDKFAEIELANREAQRSRIREEILDNFGPYGRDIAEYAEQGGNPDDLIEIFQEEQKIVSLNIETEEGQKAAVYKFQTEVVGKSPERATKYINTLIADNDLKGEAEEAKTLLEKANKEEQAALKFEQKTAYENAVKTKKANQDKFSSEITNVINSKKDIPADEKQQILKVLTKFDKKLSNGESVNDFYFKLIEFRKNPANYVELVRLVLNPEKYKKSLTIEGKNKANEKAFNLVRTAGKSKVTTSTNPNNKAEKKTGFRLL